MLVRSHRFVSFCFSLLFHFFIFFCSYFPALSLVNFVSFVSCIFLCALIAFHFQIGCCCCLNRSKTVSLCCAHRSATVVSRIVHSFASAIEINNMQFVVVVYFAFFCPSSACSRFNFALRPFGISTWNDFQSTHCKNVSVWLSCNDTKWAKANRKNAQSALAKYRNDVQWTVTTRYRAWRWRKAKTKWQRRLRLRGSNQNPPNEQTNAAQASAYNYRMLFRVLLFLPLNRPVGVIVSIWVRVLFSRCRQHHHLLPLRNSSVSPVRLVFSLKFLFFSTLFSVVFISFWFSDSVAVVIVFVDRLASFSSGSWFRVAGTGSFFWNDVCVFRMCVSLVATAAHRSSFHTYSSIERQRLCAVCAEREYIARDLFIASNGLANVSRSHSSQPLFDFAVFFRPNSRHTHTHTWSQLHRRVSIKRFIKQRKRRMFESFSFWFFSSVFVVVDSFCVPSVSGRSSSSLCKLLHYDAK